MSNNLGTTQPVSSVWSLGSDRDSVPCAEQVHEAALGDAQPGFLAGEALNLVHQLFLLRDQEPPRTVAFAGIDHGNGCSYICATIAETLARVCQRSVCLVEANFHSPALPDRYGTTNHHGLSDALATEDPIRSFTQPVKGDQLWLLSSGSRLMTSSDLLSSTRLADRLTELRSEFHFVLIDAPPLACYAETAALGQLSDGLVLVIEANATRKQSALVSTMNVRASKIPILGAVLNKRTFPIPTKLYNKL